MVRVQVRPVLWVSVLVRHAYEYELDAAGPRNEVAEPSRSGFAGSVLGGLINVYRLQFFARLETYRLTRRDVNFLTRAGVAADACFARLDVEDAEAAEFDPTAAAHGAFHGFKDRFHSLFGLRARYIRTTDHCVHDVELDHARLLLQKGKPMLTLASSLSRHRGQGGPGLPGKRASLLVIKLVMKSISLSFAFIRPLIRPAKIGDKAGSLEKSAAYTRRRLINIEQYAKIQRRRGGRAAALQRMMEGHTAVPPQNPNCRLSLLLGRGPTGRTPHC